MQKITRNNRKEHNKIAILTRSKLNGIESIISKVLIDHEDFTTNINDERNYFQLKESIRMMKSHRSNTVKKIWLKKAKELVLVKLLNILTLTIIIYISSIKQCYHIVWGAPINFCNRKVKKLYHRHMLLMIIMVKCLLERFMKKNCKK